MISSVDNSAEIRVISFCSGLAGLDLGLRGAVPTSRTVAYCEIEAYAVANLVALIEANLLDAAPVWTDLRSFPGEKFRRRIHGLIAGYPCQPFSKAGTRLGMEDARNLWPDIRRQIEAISPQFCFFENVSGHLSAGFGDVVRDLQGMGFAVASGLFSAGECGAPHERLRLFILADSDRAGREEQWWSIAARAEHSAAECGGGWPAESNMGRVDHGSPARVERLRLLGNAVVPATATRAFRHLSRELIS